MDGFLRFLLKANGVSDRLIDDIEKDYPAAARLARGVKQLKPIGEQAKPHLLALLPLIKQAAPIIEALWSDVETVAPLADEVIQFIEQKQKGTS